MRILMGIRCGYWLRRQTYALEEISGSLEEIRLFLERYEELRVQGEGER